MLALLTDFITKDVTTYGYAAIFVLMLLESACVPIPSEVTMLVGGALTTTAFAGAGNELNFVAVAVAGILGNLIGSLLAYWAGAAGGRPLVDRFGRYLLIRPHEVDRAQDWFGRRGQSAVFGARLLPVIRTFISLPAGVARMPLKRFTVYTLLGCVPWVFGLTWIGAVLGGRWEKAAKYIQPIGWLIGLALVAGIVVWIARRYTVVRREYAELDRERAAGA
jgi:membrane protein DedA with SNARE-associated domain